MDEKFPMALPKDTILAGQYVIVRVLGQGGFGITYEATDHKSGQKVAVKEFFPDTMATRTQTTVTAFAGERGESFVYGKDCFLQEAETLAQFIGNENIVRVHSYFEENGTAYFVMDFVEGTSFDAYLKEHGGRVGYEEAEKILLPVMDALAAVHSKGIVHRDVTPDNIYITKDGTVKLLDFGAARYSLGDKSRSLDVVLKHGFAPKEQYTRHGKQGAFTDVYSLGATFYFAITGRRPPDSIDRLEEDELIPPSSLGMQIPPAKEDAILKAMSVQPADRYPNMIEFKAALAGTPEPQEQPQPEPVQQRYFTQPEPIQPTVMEPVPVPEPIQPTVMEPVPEPIQPTVMEPVSEPVQTSPVPKKQKRWILPVGIGACVVAIIAVIVIAVGVGKNSGRTIVGSYPNNIAKGTTIEGENLYMYYPNVGLICVDSSDVDNYTVIDSSDFFPYLAVYSYLSLNIVGDYVYYNRGGTAYYAPKDGTGSPKEVPALQNKPIVHLWVTEDGFFYQSYTVNQTNDEKIAYTLGYVDRSGKNEESLTISSLTASNTAIAFMDDYVYYVATDDLEELQICRVPIYNLEAKTEIVHTFTCNRNLLSGVYLAAADGMIYCGSDDMLLGYSVSSGKAYEYNESDFLDGNEHPVSINAGGGYVYLSTDKQSVSSSIYRIPVSDFTSGSIAPEKIYATTSYNSIRINLFPEEGKLAFHAMNGNEVIGIMPMDGSEEPTYLGEN